MAIDNTGLGIDLLIENQFRSQGLPVLYIVDEIKADEPAQQVSFCIKNNSVHDLLLSPITVASETNYHFALVFRPGTLSQDSIQNLQTRFNEENTDWNMSFHQVRKTDKCDIWYISSINTYTFTSNSKISLSINGVSALAGTGSRSSQVQLVYNLKLKDVLIPITGTRNKHVDIVSHEGKTYAPLLFGMLGTDDLLNHAVNECAIYFIVSQFGKSIKVDKDTEIELNFPYYEKDYSPYWMPTCVLGSKDEVWGATAKDSGSVGISIKKYGEQWSPNITHLKKKGEEQKPVANDRGDVYWGYKSIKLGFGREDSVGFCRLDLENIALSGSNETSIIFVTVRNLPGYWDTDFQIPITKANIIQKGLNTGIRTDNPQFPLDLRGNMHIHGQLLIGDPEKVKHAKEAFDASDLANKDDSAIIFAPDHGTDDHAWIRFHSRSGAAHNLEIQVNKKGEDHLVLQPHEGNVGIGTDTPESKLHVKGDTIHQGDVYIGQGTSNPSDLKIFGELLFSEGKLGSVKIGKDIDPARDKILINGIYGGGLGSTYSGEGVKPKYALSWDHWGTVDVNGVANFNAGTNIKGAVNIDAGANIKGDTIIEGDVNIGGSVNKTLTVRHINGKKDESAENDHLYLNYDNRKDVYVGHNNATASLRVSGDLVVDGAAYIKKDTLTFTGDKPWNRGYVDLILEEGQIYELVHIGWKNKIDYTVGTYLFVIYDNIIRKIRRDENRIKGGSEVYIHYDNKKRQLYYELSWLKYVKYSIKKHL